MTHTEWTDRFSAYLDGELPDAERDAIDAHVAGCASCREVLDNLRRIVAVAPAYEGTAPATDLWPGIARVIERKRDVQFPVRTVASSERRRFSLAQVAAAAVLFAALGGGATWLAIGTRAVSDRPASLVETPAIGSESVIVSARATEAFDAAVVDLERILAEGRSQLDTATVRVLEENLALIDRALAEARAAVAADPANAYLNGQIAANMRRKVDILRRATSAL